jgi:hypothetical protein
MDDSLDIPEFLRRRKGENPLPAEGGSCPTILPMSDEVKWKLYEAARREHRLLKSRGRVGKMLAKKADREASAAGKHWDANKGRWI